jgi:hypothetical protein
MTDPTGRCFLSYRRTRGGEAARLIAALGDHGIPTWQDVTDLASAPAEDEIRRVLRDPGTASAVLLVTPEVESSSIIRNVEIPLLIRRSETDNDFFVVPVAAGGLCYARAAEVTSNSLTAQRLIDWNMQRLTDDELGPIDAAAIAERVLKHRIQALYRRLAAQEPLRVGLFVRATAPVTPGAALMVDWARHFSGKETAPETWRDVLLPALSRIADAIRREAPGREIEAFGFPTLPAAFALGVAFVATGGLRLAWRQITRGQSDQVWSLHAPRITSGFQARLSSKDAKARDIALLISVADDTEPVFAACQDRLPPVRALVHITKPGAYPHVFGTPGEAADVAHIVEDGLRAARREYGDVGTVHVFAAVPAGLAVLIGQTLNTFGTVQTYEHVGTDGSGLYRPAALLRPSG